MQNTLPADMNTDNTCCFTGHRIIPKERYDEIRSELAKSVKVLADNGYRYFICGGALGFDTMAAQAVTALGAKRDDVHLILALPCINQTDKWLGIKGGEEHIREYQRLKGLASGIVYIREMYTPDCMRERNQYMVDSSSFCIAYYNGSPKSGSGQTYRMAKRAGLTIYNICDGSTGETDTQD